MEPCADGRSTLRTLKRRLTRVRKEKGNVFLQHDNARPHTSRATTAELQRLNLTTVQHPPFSPELAPSDFHLFPIMKEDLRGHHYAFYAHVERTVRLWLRKQCVDFFRDGFRKLVHRWRKCMQLSGDYVEKWILVIKNHILRII